MKKILILGAHSHGKTTLAKAIALANVEAVAIVNAKDIKSLSNELDRFSETLPKATAAAHNFTRAVDVEDLFIPKKIHPKHQSNNKYRFKR